ncbi:hypothetical protein D3C78_818230 [compost metagenome]
MFQQVLSFASLFGKLDDGSNCRNPTTDGQHAAAATFSRQRVQALLACTWISDFCRFSFLLLYVFQVEQPRQGHALQSRRAQSLDSLTQYFLQAQKHKLMQRKITLSSHT